MIFSPHKSAKSSEKAADVECLRKADQPQRGIGGKSKTFLARYNIYYLTSPDGSTLRKVQGARWKPNTAGGSWGCGCQVVSNLTAVVTTL